MAPRAGNIMLRPVATCSESGKMATYGRRAGGRCKELFAQMVTQDQARPNNRCSDREQMGTAARGRAFQCAVAKIKAPALLTRRGGPCMKLSADGSAWSYFPWEHAISRAYRWNEDDYMAGSRRRSGRPASVEPVEPAGSPS